MENKIKRKINTCGRVAKILTMIVIVCLLVAEGFLLAGGVIAAVVPKDSVTVETDSRTEILVDTKFFGVEEEKLYINVGGGSIGGCYCCLVFLPSADEAVYGLRYPVQRQRRQENARLCDRADPLHGRLSDRADPLHGRLSRRKRRQKQCPRE